MEIYNIDGQFFSGHGGIMQVGIRNLSQWLWQGVDSGTFNFDISVMVGESIDFLVWGAYGGGSTPLKLTISPPPEPITISIDIQPGKHPAKINLHSDEEITVAILSTSEFNAPDIVDKDSLTFGHTGNEDSLALCYHRPEDVNGDGLEDLICHFYTQDTGFRCPDTVGILFGKTRGGTTIKGSGSVKIQSCK